MAKQQFQDLSEFLDPTLPLPISGKIYRVPSPDVATGLRAQATVALAAKVKAGENVTSEDVASLKLDDDQEIEFTQSMLGSAFAEMVEDGLPWEYVQHAAKTAFMWLVSDRDQAGEVWSSLGEAERPAPQDRRPKTPGSTKKATSGSSSKKKTSRPTRDAAGTPS